MNAASNPEGSIVQVHIPCPRATIMGELAVPSDPQGLVIFVHGSGGGWTDSKNWPVAWKLHQSGFSTLLLDLLTDDETALRSAKGFTHFELPLLVERLSHAVGWAKKLVGLETVGLSLFASEADAAAAIEVASALKGINAVACRSGRTDLVGDSARGLEVPLLLIAAEYDRRTLRWNREFIEQLHCTRRLEVVVEATHQFGEEGAIGKVAELAAGWFELYGKTPEDSLEEAWIA